MNLFTFIHISGMVMRKILFFKKDEVDEVKWMDTDMVQAEILNNDKVWNPPYLREFLTKL